MRMPAIRIRHVLAGMLCLCSFLTVARASDDDVAARIEALHARWFKAFDAGDGAAMDRIEMPDLMLVLPSGDIWRKTARAGHQNPSGATHDLESPVVRVYGDAAILTGFLITHSAAGVLREATTVVFVRSAGDWKVASAQWVHLPADK